MKKSIIRLIALCLALSMTACVLGSCGIIGGTDSGNNDGGTNVGDNNNNQNNNSNNNTNDNNNDDAGNTSTPDKGEGRLAKREFSSHLLQPMAVTEQRTIPIIRLALSLSLLSNLEHISTLSVAVSSKASLQ